MLIAWTRSSWCSKQLEQRSRQVLTDHASWLRFASFTAATKDRVTR